MPEDLNNFQQLQKRLADLQKRQELFQSEILLIKNELDKLISKNETPDNGIDEEAAVQPVFQPEKEQIKEETGLRNTHKPLITADEKPRTQERRIKSDIERFIGENLINKIGIAITVIGVGIGAKYAIDHQLISPLTRIILGYLVGLGLLFFAIRLKKNYESFSAVLLSGSMAIMYFITYSAYSFYGIYPQAAAFLLMVLFTVITVSAALIYDREVVAMGGMVGALAIPFLLSEGAAHVMVFFSYVSIINIGILVIAIKKYWKPLYFSSFVLTWLIYFTWYFRSFRSDKDITLALIFLFIFFLIFYLTFLAYKLLRKEKFNVFDIVLLLSNSFIFYGLGYAILNGNQSYKNSLGLFTLGNALIHTVVSFVIYRNKLADRNLFYMVSGLVVVFLTIAIPVQLNGNWVTLLWVCEAAALFAVGRIRTAPVYENISYILLIISFLSLAEDWSKFQIRAGYTDPPIAYAPFLNIQFLSSMIYIAAFSVILLVFYSRRYISPHAAVNSTRGLLEYGLPSLFILVVYLAFRNEISAYYNHIFSTSGIENSYNFPDSSDFRITVDNFKKLWLCNYTLFFLSVLSFVNFLKIKKRPLGVAIFWLSMLILAVFLSQSLYILSELRESYINRSPADYFMITRLNITIRYLSFMFVLLLLGALNKWLKKENPDRFYRIVFSLMFHLTVLWILCSEMLNILDLRGGAHSYRFGLSILTGVYALIMIVLGISGKKRYLRIAAMALLAATLAKLFFYDISRLDTILKTILFLALGFLLLLVSFLYNKYTVRLYGDPGKDTSDTKLSAEV